MRHWASLQINGTARQVLSGQMRAQGSATTALRTRRLRRPRSPEDRSREPNQPAKSGFLSQLAVRFPKQAPQSGNKVLIDQPSLPLQVACGT
jgi:hypothetical protein